VHNCSLFEPRVMILFVGIWLHLLLRYLLHWKRTGGVPVGDVVGLTAFLCAFYNDNALRMMKHSISDDILLFGIPSISYACGRH